MQQNLPALNTALTRRSRVLGFKNTLLARTILLVVGIASTRCAMVRKLLRAGVGARSPPQPFARLGSSMLMYDMCALQRAESLAERRLGLCILLLAL